MMKEYFSEENNQKVFYEILRNWLGTPYMHMTEVKGRGADCVLFIAACLKEMGIFKTIEYTFMHRDWMIFGKEEKALENWENNFKNLAPGLTFKNIDVKAPDVFGDFLTFSMYLQNGLTNHVGVYVGENTFIHCIQRKGVIIEPFRDVMKMRQTRRYRLFIT